MSDKPLCYLNDDNTTIVYRASTFGHCDRALTAARLQYPASPTPASLQTIFSAGHDAEAWYMSVHELDDQQREVQLTHNNTAVRGHLDGTRTDNWDDKLVVVEVKSQSPALFDAWTPDLFTSDPLWQKYAWQFSIYMHATGAELELVRIRRPENDESYQTAFYRLEKPLHSLSAIHARIDHLNDLAFTEQLPACSTIPTFGCPYYQLHEGPSLSDDPALDSRARAFIDAKLMTKLAKETEDGLKKELLKVLDGRTEVATLGGFSVKYSTFEKKAYQVAARTETRLTVTETKQ